MRIGIAYSGVGGPNGADYVAEYMAAEVRAIGHTPVMFGRHGGYDFETEILYPADIYIHSSGFNLTTKRVDFIRAHAPLVVYTHNDEIWPDLAGICARADLHASYSPAQFTGARQLYMRHGNKMYCPIGASAEHYHWTGCTQTDKIYDVCLIGSRRRWRVDFCDAIAKRFPNSFFGWSMIKDVREINGLYNLTKVVIAPVQDCDLDVPGRAGGCPCRTFDVRAAGAFQLETVRAGLQDVYRPQISHLFTPHNMADAVDMWVYQIDYFLHHPDVRHYIAEQEYQWTMNNHLYRHRVNAMVNAVLGKSLL